MGETLSGSAAAAGGAREGRWRRFWQRQLGFEKGERPGGFNPVGWDLAFGVVLPVLCFVFDPIVFRNRGTMERFQFFVYAFSGLQMTALLAWLACGRRLGDWGGVVGGVLVAGALFSFAIGVVLLPFSLIGLIFVVGALGFIPFLTAAVYLRNGLHALRSYGWRGAAVPSAVCGIFIALAAPALMQVKLEHLAEATLAAALEGRPTPPAAAQASAWAAVLTRPTFDRFVWAYYRERDPARKARLAAAYWQLTGRDIRARLAWLLD